MPPDVITIGDCPQCRGSDLACRYNRFQRDELRIDSWEHKCPDCGFRQTQAFRSDEPPPAGVDPTVCPYCGRTGSA